jgi:putative membrane protein
MPRWSWLNGSPKAAAMQFLKTLLWVVVAVFLAILANRNWHDVTINLWGDIQADIKVPVLLIFTFLLGCLPTFLVLRARIWRLQQRLDSFERQQLTTRAAEPRVEEAPLA